MVDEKEDSYELHEEGEYHFSDDQATYETEPGTAKVNAAGPASSNAKEKLTLLFNRHRRTIIGVVVFFTLIFVVYKMLAPNTTAPATEFNPNSVSKPPAKTPLKPAKSLVPETPAMTMAPPAAAPEVAAQSSQALPASATPIQQPTQMVPPPAASLPGNPSAQAMLAQTTMVTPPPAVNPAPIQTQPVAPVNTMVQPQTAPPTDMTATTVTTAPVTQEAAPSKIVLDRLAALEEQNTKLMNLLQTQVAPKIAEYQTENIALKERVLLLNKRLVNMEVSINKMAQIIQDQGQGYAKSQTVMSGAIPAMPPTKVMQPKMIYTVQAIIPGRAWLKSDGGDTITVAEGDTLKDYGRVTKIDPYDGVVEIDTGNKIVSLSYGTNGD